MLTYHKTTEEEKYQITAWKYPGEYAIYDNAPYEEQKAKGYGFASAKNFFTPFMTGQRWWGSSIYMKRKPRCSLASA